MSVVIAWHASKSKGHSIPIHLQRLLSTWNGIHPYTPATFFLSTWNGIHAKLQNSIPAKLQKSHFWSFIFNQQDLLNGCSLLCLCVFHWGISYSGHWYRNIPAALAMHFPQAMEILEGDGSDASVSTITMSKAQGPKKG